MQARASAATNSNETVIAAEARAQLVAPVAAQTVAVREVSLHQITKRLSLGALGQDARRILIRLRSIVGATGTPSDFYDPNKKELVRQGHATITIDPKSIQEKQRKTWTPP